MQASVARVSAFHRPRPAVVGNFDDEQARTPPHSLEAEHAVLGALLCDPSVLSVVVDVLAPGDFFRHEHNVIYQAIVQLGTAGQPVDPVTVFEALDGEPCDFGGLAYLTDLSNGVSSSRNVRRYAEIVAERAVRRGLIAVADRLAARAFNPPDGMTAGEALDQSGEDLRTLRDVRGLRSRRLPLVGLEELIAHASAREYLIKGLIPASSIGVLFGGSGSFKSFLAIDAGLHVAHGMRWLGRRTKQGPVVYVAAEGGDELGQRADAWHRARRLQPSAPFHVVPVAIDLLTEAWRVVETVQAVGVTPALVIVDTMSQTFSGEENVANDVAAYMRELGRRFRDLWGCAVLVIHHSGHTATERPRGSSAIQANTDYLYGVMRDEKEMLATLVCTHRKGGSLFDDATFALASHELGRDADGDPITSLVARHLTSGEEVQQVMAAEAKAGRGGKNRLLLSLLQNGMREAELRRAFYEDCDLSDPESRKKAFQRARAWAIKAGFIDIAQGVVIILKQPSGT